MNLRKLGLENFRSFEQAEIPLCEDLNDLCWREQRRQKQTLSTQSGY